MDTTDKPLNDITSISDADLRIYRAQGSRLAAIGVAEILADHKRKAKWYATRLRRFLPSTKDAVIVDIPCGEGNILFFLQELGYSRVTGYEIDADRVQLAKQMQFNAIQANALEVVETLRNVEVFFCVDFIEHISKEAAIEFLLRLNRALSPCGRLILRTPITDSPRETIHLHNDFTHKWAVNSAVWQTIATATGYTLIAVIDERPAVDTPLHACMRGVFEVAKIIYTAQCHFLNLPTPRSWTPSAWFVMDKNRQGD